MARSSAQDREELGLLSRSINSSTDTSRKRSFGAADTGATNAADASADPPSVAVKPGRHRCWHRRGQRAALRRPRPPRHQCWTTKWRYHHHGETDLPSPPGSEGNHPVFGKAAQHPLTPDQRGHQGHHQGHQAVNHPDCVQAEPTCPAARQRPRWLDGCRGLAHPAYARLVPSGLGHASSPGLAFMACQMAEAARRRS